MSDNFYYQSTVLGEAYLVVLGELFLSPNYTSQGLPASGELFFCESFFDRQNSLQFYFGINATQNENNLYINKGDLTGLTPSTNNSAESLLIALLLKNLDITSDSDDLIAIKLFDTYISGNKIKNTILIQPSYLAPITNNELHDLPTSINPMNYD